MDIERRLTNACKNKAPLSFIEGYLGKTSAQSLNRIMTAACLHGRDDIVKLLLVDDRVTPEMDLLDSACRYGHTAVVELLINDMRIDLRGEDDAAFTNACTFGHTSTVKLMITHPRFKATQHDYKEGFWTACAFGQREVADFCLPGTMQGKLPWSFLDIYTSEDDDDDDT